MRKPLNNTQCVILTLFWAALCFIVLTSASRIDGLLIITILISGALVFIPSLSQSKAVESSFSSVSSCFTLCFDTFL